MKSIRNWLVGAGAALALLAGLSAQAQDYPTQPIRIVVPYPPGGFNDTLGRKVAEHFGKVWKQSVVVDNRPGGNTIIGNTAVAKAPPDGHTLLVTPLPFAALPALYGDKLPYDARKDFTPVIWAASTQNTLVVRNELPIQNVRELLDYARKNPGKLNYGSTGSGSSNHLSMELFQRMAGVKLTHIPYKGSAPAVMAMLGGEIDALFDNVPNVIQQIRSGKLRAIGVSGTSRSALLPDVPTVAESGVPGFEVNVWFGVQAPAGTPHPIVQKLNAEIARLLREPETVKQFREQGVEVVASTPTRFAELLDAEIPKWSAVVKEAKVKVE